MENISIGNTTIGDEHSAFVIAEAGNNHNNDISLAKDLIDVAAEAGADAVKFQLAKAANTYVKNSGSVKYLEDKRDIYNIVEDIELPQSWIAELCAYCEDKNIMFLTTPYDTNAVDLLEEYVPAYKIASYTLSHHPFLEYVANKNKPIIMSTGAHSIDEIEDAVSVLRRAGVSDLVLLQCVASYPTPIDQINVRVINQLRDRFDTHTGLSDHTTDPNTAPCAAVALGGRVIEKHFTLDRSMEGPDHSFALEPDELRQMVTAIRSTESALGNTNKRILDVEHELQQMAKRGIQATQDISAGEKITDDNIAVLRPGKCNRGIKPKFYSNVLEATTLDSVREGAGVTWDDIDKNNPQK